MLRRSSSILTRNHSLFLRSRDRLTQSLSIRYVWMQCKTYPSSLLTKYKLRSIATKTLPSLPLPWEKDSPFQIIWGLGLQQVTQYYDIDNQLKDSDKLDPQEIAKLAKSLKSLTTVKDLIEEITNNINDMEVVKGMIKEEENKKNKKNQETIDWANSEKKTFLETIERLKNDLMSEVLPKDEDDSRNVILELRAGVGGEEASLFVDDIYRMYQKYSVIKNWKFHILDISKSDQGGMKEASISVIGNDVYGTLKYENGTHRVQRVPQTETNGRVHTSAMMVIVLPEVEPQDFILKDSDLKIDTFRAGGKGGQSVNNTDSAVRVTHLPTGFSVSMQDERSQHQNRIKALQVLRSRLYAQQREQIEKEKSQTRHQLVGSGDRSERIRTYNFSQGRVTDHRVNVTKHDIQKMLAGEYLDEIIGELKDQSKLQALENLKLQATTASPAKTGKKSSK